MDVKKLTELSNKMRQLDICMLTTKNSRGSLNCRPMSNNGDVEYKGDSYFFSYESASVIKDLDKNPQVSLGFEGKGNLYIAVTGMASLVRSKGNMKEHWMDKLKMWFSEGLDTPGIIMIHVKASRIKYWQNEEQGEIDL